MRKKGSARTGLAALRTDVRHETAPLPALQTQRRRMARRRAGALGGQAVASCACGAVAVWLRAVSRPRGRERPGCPAANPAFGAQSGARTALSAQCERKGTRGQGCPRSEPTCAVKLPPLPALQTQRRRMARRRAGALGGQAVAACACEAVAVWLRA